MLNSEKREWMLRRFKEDRIAAHHHLFAHRHKDADPAFHRELLELLYSEDSLVAMMAFRGAAKSTLLEEYVLLSALFQEFVFPIIVGPKWESACERLAPIRNELENNDVIIELFGDQKSSPWSMDELVLANGVKIQAVGAGQSMRGKKHNDERPDVAVIDDLEDEENIRTEESRDRTERWLTGTLLPALHPTKRKVRFAGTAIHPKSLIIKKCNDPKWKSKIFPIINIDTETGEEKSAWPARFPMAWIKEEQLNYLNAGRYVEFEQEYMCRAEDIAGKAFQPRMIKVAPAPVQYLPVEIFVDPARTVKKTSARTGYVAWSWLGNQLIVHEAEGHFHKPDEIVRKIAEWDERFKPVRIGVEADGLEEFLMQPLRAMVLQIGRSMPIVAERAPRDKRRFIEGLQPFYIAGDVIHVKHLPDLEQELLQFPTGRIDVPNALAYALKMRAGRPVYEDFTARHLALALEPRANLPRYLCVSSRPAMTAAALVQYDDGTLRIYRDWAINEPPQECFGRILREAILAGGKLEVCAPQEQFDRYANNGLPAAIKAEFLQAKKTGWAAKSEGQLRPWLQKQKNGFPCIMVQQDCRWVVGGFSRGYVRRLDKSGKLSDQPEDNQYRLIMEGLESFVAYFDGIGKMENDGLTYARTPSGQQYISLRR
jgi:hypothetical protein